MLQLVLLSALASVAIAAPAPLTAGTDYLPFVQPANILYPELNITGYYPGPFLGRIYSSPNASTTHLTSSGISQPIVHIRTGYSSPLRLASISSFVDYLSYISRPWTVSNVYNNQGYGYQGQGYGPPYGWYDDDDDDDDDYRGGWGAWGDGHNDGWGNDGWGHGHGGGGHGAGGNGGWGHRPDREPDTHHGSGARPNVVNQVFTVVS